MRQQIVRAVAAVIMLLAVAPLFASPANAAQAVTAWVETAATSPGVGCVVDVSVEVRSGSGTVGGAQVSVSLSEDGTTNIISTDSATTSDAGVAWLVMDTSAGWNGMKGWMDVAVNGSYLGGQSIWITGGGCTDGGSLIELDGSIAPAPAAPTNAGTSSASSGDNGAVIIPGVIKYQQQRGLSCEYSALAIATGSLGDWVSEYDFESVVPLSDNPHWGYRGDITGSWGNTDNYGIYAEPLVPALNHFGFNGNVFYGAGSNDALIAAIDRGEPTLVWLGMHGPDGTFDAYTADGTRYQLTPYMHVMVAYGYDDGGVYLSNPGTGALTYYDWGTFMWMWNVMDGMSLSVSW